MAELSAALTIDSIRLAPANLLSIQGDYTIIEDLFAFLGDDTLQAWTGEAWTFVDSANAALFITTTYSDGYTNIEAIPEPSTWALLGLALGGLLISRKRRTSVMPKGPKGRSLVFSLCPATVTPIHSGGIDSKIAVIDSRPGFVWGTGMHGAVIARAVIIPFLFLLTSAHGALVFEKQRLEFTPPASEKKVEGRFAFTNKGTEPITIRKVTTNCGCTTAKLEKKTYLPGESGEIISIFKFGSRKGLQIKHVLVESNDPATPQVSLELKVTISDQLRVRPSLVFWKKDEAPTPKTITLETRGGYAIDSLKVTPSDPRVKAVATPLADGNGYALSITPERGSGPIRATLKIEINQGKEDAVTSLAHVKAD